MKKLYLILSVFLLTIGLAFNCYAAPKGTFTQALNDFTYESFDPTFYRTFFGDCLYDNILDRDEKGGPVPALAESFTLSKDGKTWTFKVRKGAKWHNGDPVTSADFMFTVKRFGDTTSTNPWSRYFQKYESMETPDDHTFIYRTEKPEPLLKEAWIAVQVIPKKYFEAVGPDEFQNKPVGSGPWKYVKFVSGERMEMVANEDHWAGEPYYKNLIYLEVPEEGTQIAMIKRGEIDMTYRVSQDNAAALRDQGWRLQAHSVPTIGNITFCGVYDTDSPTKDIKVRQAMSYAINREEMAAAMFQGFAEPGGQWAMFPGSWGWDPKWKFDKYNPDKAKALLKEAGYPDKYANPVIKVWAPVTGITPDFMQALAGYWEDVGIQTQVLPMDRSEFGKYFFNKKNPKNKEVINGAIAPFIWGAVMNNVYHSGNLYNIDGMHPTGYDPKCNEMFKKLIVELDPDKAVKLFREYQEYGFKQYINLSTLMIYEQYIVGPKVGEFTKNWHRGFFKAAQFIKPK